VGALAGGGCAGAPPAPDASDGGRAQAVIARPAGQDTIRFAIPVVLRHCRSPRPGLLFEAVGGGNGLLVWLRGEGVDSSTSGEFPILGVRDTVTPRGAVVAVRYLTGELAHGYALDSGSVNVTASPGRLGLRVLGSGLETPGAFRPLLDAALDSVALVASPSAGDSVPCEPLK
jgi:hypothetical protein